MSKTREFKIVGNGWTGFWIMIGLSAIFWGWGNRMDCFLKVPGACEKLAENYVEKPLTTDKH